MAVDEETRGTRAEAGAPTADGAATAARTEPGSAILTGAATMVPTWGSTTYTSLPAPGYQLGEQIGHGGMGEVIAAQDQRIGREVAVKRIRSRTPSPDAVTRFLREARIQARLDHPAIVPVYELGTDDDGRPYFTMKRLAGVTLAKRLATGSPVQPLLRAFVDVCLAIQLAHARGVVHRDLKPSNIMLGDYGEVYVLDWGVARVLTDTTRPVGAGMTADIDDGTTAGAILGTPGYMSPEQVRGTEAGTKADVYSLGAILFEILSGQPLHPRGEAALGSTLSSPQSAPAARVQERTIPPELDGACFDALAEDPAERPTARELADRVQAYLDGDRDVERRKAMAAEQLNSARSALELDEPDARAMAIRRAGRALALDPESVDAASLVTAMLLEPPAKMPPDLVASLAKDDAAFSNARSRQGVWAYLSLFVFWAMVPFLSVKSWTALISFYGMVLLGAGVAWRSSTRGRPSLASSMVITSMLVLVFSRIASPLILTPIMICAILMQLGAMRQLADRLWIVMVWTLVTALLPFVLEWIGLLHPTYAVGGGVLVTRSDVFDMRGHVEEIALVATNLVFVLSAGAIAVFIGRARHRASRQLQIQAWHLRQLLPNAKRWHTQPRGVLSPPA